MDRIEAIAFALGVVNVTLVVRRSVWNYPFGIATVALYAFVFADAKLYSDMLLQAFFLVVNVYGWVRWSQVRAEAGTVVVRALAPAARIVWGAGCVAVAIGWGAGMHAYTDASFPWWDGSIAVVSVAAQMLMAERRFENWLLWIGVDIGSIGLYAAKGLWLTMLLYAIFLGLAVWGLRDWRQVMREQAA